MAFAIRLVSYGLRGAYSVAALALVLPWEWLVLPRPARITVPVSSPGCVQVVNSYRQAVYR
jgi:hypothetical protein